MDITFILSGIFCIGLGVVFVRFAETILKWENRWKVRGDPTPTRWAVINQKIFGWATIGVGAVVLLAGLFWDPICSFLDLFQF